MSTPLKKFTRKPHVVEAIQYDGYTEHLPYEMGVEIRWSARNGRCIIETEKEFLHCDPGYWIIKDAKGQFSLCSAEEFEEVYAPMEIPPDNGEEQERNDA